MNYAGWFFRHHLTEGFLGEKARSYLEKREITLETQETFKLGYSLPEWDALSHFLQSRKIPMDKAVELGLVRQRKDGGYYDFFRDRVLFPLFDFEGRVMGFGGRRLSEDPKAGPKYVNSPESPIYHKGESIYGLFQAKNFLRETGKVILVEGNLDLIRLHQAGIKNVVAPLGTALTKAQIRVMKRFAEKIFILFDGDRAGQNATLKALSLCLENGEHPFVVRLPEGEDPDSMIAHGKEAVLKEQLEKAPLGLDWLISQALSQKAKTPQEKVNAVKSVLPFVSYLSSPLEKKTYQARLAQYLGVDERNLADGLSIGQRNESFGYRTTPKKSLERILLELYVNHPRETMDLIPSSVWETCRDEPIQLLGLKIQDRYQQGVLGFPSSETEADSLMRSLLVSEMKDLLPGEARQMTTDLLNKIRKENLKRDLKELTQNIHLAEISHDEPKLKDLITQKNEVVCLLKNL